MFELRRIRELLLITSLGVLAVSGCASHSPTQISQGDDDEMHPGTVLPANTRLSAKNRAGEVHIEAGQYPLRVFSWHGKRQGAITELDSHDKGLVFSGRPQVWEDRHGMARLRYHEGQKDFEDAEEAVDWLQDQGESLVYSSSGMALQWQPTEKMLDVRVLQITVDGDAPEDLDGADDEHIALKSLSDLEDEKGWFRRYIVDPIGNVLSWSTGG